MATGGNDCSYARFVEDQSQTISQAKEGILQFYCRKIQQYGEVLGYEEDDILDLLKDPRVRIGSTHKCKDNIDNEKFAEDKTNEALEGHASLVDMAVLGLIAPDVDTVCKQGKIYRMTIEQNKKLNELSFQDYLKSSAKLSSQFMAVKEAKRFESKDAYTLKDAKTALEDFFSKGLGKYAIHSTVVLFAHGDTNKRGYISFGEELISLAEFGEYLQAICKEAKLEAVPGALVLVTVVLTPCYSHHAIAGLIKSGLVIERGLPTVNDNKPNYVKKDPVSTVPGFRAINGETQIQYVLLTNPQHPLTKDLPTFIPSDEVFDCDLQTQTDNESNEQHIEEELPEVYLNKVAEHFKIKDITKCFNVDLRYFVKATAPHVDSTFEKFDGTESEATAIKDLTIS